MSGKMARFIAIRKRFETDLSLRDKSSEELSALLDVRVDLIRRWAKELNIALGPHQKEREMMSKKAAMLGSGMIVDGVLMVSLSRLGRAYGVCSDTTSKWLIEAGIDRNINHAYNTSIDDQPDLPEAAKFIARHLESWKRNPKLNEVVWPIIEKRRWHDSTHHTG